MRVAHPQRYLFPLLLLLACSLTMGLRDTLADQSVKSSSTQAELLQQQKKMQRLQHGMQRQQSLIVSSQKKESRLLDELQTITAKLRNERARLQDLEQQLAVQQQNLEVRQQELAALTKDKAKLQQHVEKRLAAYYRMGRTGFLNAIFSNSGLASLLRFDEAFQLMIERDRQAAQLFKKKIQESEEAAEQLRNQKEILVALVAEVREQEQRYSRIKEQRQALLDRVQTEKKLYENALDEIQTAAKALTDELSRLKEEAAAEAQAKEEAKAAKEKEKKTSGKKNEPRFAGPTFASQKGSLSPPVDGTVTETFGKSTTKKFGLTLQTNGISIAAPLGAAIKAIYHGRVVYVGELKGYGNIIILDHGQQYYSLVSRAEKYFKQKGDWVMTGEVIGMVGEDAGLLEEGVHFEIRQGTKPLNPLDWLRPGSLKIAAAARPSEDKRHR